MLLDRILSEPLRSLQYMEQHVNRGSPSGYTDIHKPSPRYAPGSSPTPFPLWACATMRTSAVRRHGHVPALPVDEEVEALYGDNWIYIHPDMRWHKDLQDPELSLIRLGRPVVLPTSSGRTVQIESEQLPWYVKLSYDGLLGRINRALPANKAMAGPEISAELVAATESGLLPPETHILHETGARVLHIDDHRSWGMVIREYWPRGQRADEIVAIVPMFSMFSLDAHQPGDPFILSQLLTRWRHGALQMLVRQILSPVLETYFGLVRQLGLQPELNAQNVLLGLDSNANVVGVVLRDFMGVEKDMDLRTALGLSMDFKSSPYKCIGRYPNALYYQIRHSFSFDFKLCTYVLDPLVQIASEQLQVDMEMLRNEVRQLVALHLEQLPSGYLPRDAWFCHPTTLLDQVRPYVYEVEPRYRSAIRGQRRGRIVAMPALCDDDQSKPQSVLAEWTDPSLRKGDAVTETPIVDKGVGRTKRGYLNVTEPVRMPPYVAARPFPSQGRIGLFSPSEPVGGGRLTRLIRNLDQLRSLGYEVVDAQYAYEASAYVAGSVRQRVADLHDLAARDDIDLLLSTWGGKQCNQLLESLNFELLTRKRKPIVSFSDGCVLLNALTAITGLVSFHGPNVAGKLDESLHASFDELRTPNLVPDGNVFGKHAPDNWTVLRAGRSEGRLFGGNLSTFVLGLVGTRFLDAMRDIIFFWENIGDRPQIIDQYLTCLRNAGFFDRVVGMVVGDLMFDELDPEQAWKERHVFATIMDAVGTFDFPVVYCPTFGHRKLENPMVPIGPRCELDAIRVRACLTEAVVA